MNRNKWFVNFFIGFVKITGFLPALLFMKPKVYLIDNAKRRLPAPCILMSNHKNLVDFMLYLLVFPFRTIRFLMAEVLFNKGKLFAWFLYGLGGIKVERNDFDFGFVSNCFEVLDKKGIVGIFPEGRIPIGGKPWPFTVSSAYIALNTDAPVVPVYTDGNYGLFKRAKVAVGEAFYLSDYKKEGLNDEEQLEHLRKVLEQKVYYLKDEMEKRTKK